MEIVELHVLKAINEFRNNVQELYSVALDLSEHGSTASGCDLSPHQRSPPTTQFTNNESDSSFTLVCIFPLMNGCFIHWLFLGSMP